MQQTTITVNWWPLRVKLFDNIKVVETFSFAFSPKNLWRCLCKRSGPCKQAVKMLHSCMVSLSLLLVFTFIVKQYHWHFDYRKQNQVLKYITLHNWVNVKSWGLFWYFVEKIRKFYVNDLEIICPSKEIHITCIPSSSPLWSYSPTDLSLKSVRNTTINTFV